MMQQLKLLSFCPRAVVGSKTSTTYHILLACGARRGALESLALVTSQDGDGDHHVRQRREGDGEDSEADDHEDTSLDLVVGGQHVKVARFYPSHVQGLGRGQQRVLCHSLRPSLLVEAVPRCSEYVESVEDHGARVRLAIGRGVACEGAQAVAAADASCPKFYALRGRAVSDWGDTVDVARFRDVARGLLGAHVALACEDHLACVRYSGRRLGRHDVVVGASIG